MKLVHHILYSFPKETFLHVSNIFQPERMNRSHCLVNSGFHLSFGDNCVLDGVVELLKALAFRCRYVTLLFYAPQLVPLISFQP